MKAEHRRHHTDRARSLRREQTDAEQALWRALRSRQLDGLKFKRQVSIGNYIADLMCFECMLMVEIDGSQHLEQFEYDERRTKWLSEHGFRVLRFWNVDALSNTTWVVEEIRTTANERRPSFSPP